MASSFKIRLKLPAREDEEEVGPSEGKDFKADYTDSEAEGEWRCTVSSRCNLC